MSPWVSAPLVRRKRDGRPSLLLGAFSAALFVIASPAFSQPKVEVIPQTNKSPEVTAVGRAVRSVAPDIAILSFGIEIRDPSTTNAVLVNKRMTEKAVKGLEKSGVPPADISVAPYQMEHVVGTFIPALGTNQPVEFQIQQKGTYRVTSEIKVTTHSVSNVGSIIDAALAAGVDRIGPIHYRTSRRKEIEAELVTEAVADARRVAETLAKSEGLTLGDLLRVSSLSGGSDSTAAGSNGEPASAQSMISEGSNSPSVDVRTEVRVVFAAMKVGD